MSSIVGPLVKPNRLETRFDRTAFYTRAFRHPILNSVVLLIVAAAVAAVATHIVRLPI